LNQERLEISLDNDLRELAGVASEIDRFCEARDLEPQIAYAVNLSVDEILTNTISYAYDDDETHRIELVVRMDDGALVVVIEDDSAAEGSDYMEVADFPIAVESGAASGSGTFTITPVDDTMAEGAEAITVDGRLKGASIQAARLTLVDNDDPPNGIALSASPTSVAEDGRSTPITVTATVSGSTTYAQDVEVTVSVGGGTATAGADFSPVEDFGITIAGGESSGSAHFALSPIDDDDSEGDETVAITGAAGDIDIAATAVTIEDDEAPVRQVVLSASEVAVDEGASASWNVKLSAVPDGPVVVTISGHDGTDLSLDDARLEFDRANWNSAQTVTVTAGEDDDTADDSATLAHAASGGGYGSASASLRVDTADNDTPVILLKPDTLELIEGRSKSYAVTLATEPSGEVAVAISGHAGTYLRLDTSNLVFTASDWNVAQTVTVTAEDDGVDGEPMRDSQTLAHAGSGGGYDGVEAELSIDVLLDPIVMTIDDAEGPEGSYLEFRVHLSKPSPGDVEANWNTQAEVAQSGRDFEPSEGRLRFAEGEQEKVIRVWAEEDDVDDPNEMFAVELWNPAGAVFDNPVMAVPGSHTHDARVGVAVEIMPATGTIVGPAPDPPELTISASETFVDEGGTTRVTVTATVANELERAIRVPLVYSNGTAEDGDFEGDPGLWIQSGASQGSVDIAALRDEDADDETFTVSIGELRPLEAVAGDDYSVELTVLDDDGVSVSREELCRRDRARPVGCLVVRQPDHHDRKAVAPVGGLGRQVEVRREANPVPHRDHEIRLDAHLVLRLGDLVWIGRVRRESMEGGAGARRAPAVGDRARGRVSISGTGGETGCQRDHDRRSRTDTQNPMMSRIVHSCSQRLPFDFQRIQRLVIRGRKARGSSHPGASDRLISRPRLSAGLPVTER